MIIEEESDIKMPRATSRRRLPRFPRTWMRSKQSGGNGRLMADIILTQAEANALIAMEKHRSNDERQDFPMGAQSLSVPLHSADRREHFSLDLSRGRIDLRKVKMQNRGRQVVVLVRLDL